MAPLLLYTEIVPFRDSFTEHALVTRPFVDLARAVRMAGGEALVLANNETADHVLDHDEGAGLHLLRLNADEEARVQALLRPWSAAAVQDWLDLVRGRGAAADLVEGVLARVHARHGFGAVLGWSDNGAVARFCDARGIGRLHVELGPTRAPLPGTIYFDDRGTNALASFRDPRALLAAPPQPPLELWLAAFDRGHDSDEVPGLVDRPLTWGAAPPALRALRDRRLAYVPLQLADDLNTLLGAGPASPEAFLREVLPPLVAAGYLPVVKPHPATAERPFNLLEGARALRVLRNLPPGAIVELAAADAEAGQWLLGNAALVVAVNSSVGFEAALHGTPVALVGEAAYDFASFPRFDPSDPAAAAAPEPMATVARAVSLMLSEHLYPSSLLGSPRLARALLDAAGDVGTGGQGLAAALRRSLGPARTHHLGLPGPAPDPGPAPGSAGPADLDWFVGRPVAVEGDRLRVGPLAFALAPAAFEGRVDRVRLLEGDDEAEEAGTAEGRDAPASRRLRCRGHALAADGRRPASGVLLVADGRVIGAAPVRVPRADLPGPPAASRAAGFGIRLPLEDGLAPGAIRFVPFDLARREAAIWDGPAGPAAA